MSRRFFILQMLETKITINILLDHISDTGLDGPLCQRQGTSIWQNLLSVFFLQQQEVDDGKSTINQCIYALGSATVAENQALYYIPTNYSQFTDVPGRFGCRESIGGLA